MASEQTRGLPNNVQHRTPLLCMLDRLCRGGFTGIFPIRAQKRRFFRQSTTARAPKLGNRGSALLKCDRPGIPATKRVPKARPAIVPPALDSIIMRKQVDGREPDMAARRFVPFLVAAAAAVILSAGGPLTAQQASQNVAEAQRAFRLLNEGKYLAALTAMEQSAPAGDSAAQQELATLRSFVGDCAEALQAMDAAVPNSAAVGKTSDLPEQAAPQSALDAIVAAARDRQIVILNEAHHVPRHREFSRQLMVRLREAGFEYLAAETFNPNTASLVRRKYPNRSTGYYSMEPVFGQMIRQAMQLGYQPVAYETPKLFGQTGDNIDRINARETAQCHNLIRQIFSRAPDARVFIHVGYSHATEDFQKLADGRELAWMAARLKRETGIDPLTIDQTSQTERSRPELSSPDWQRAAERNWLNGPVVVVNGDGTSFVSADYRGRVDMQVFHPPARLVDGRPDWLHHAGHRQPVPIPAGLTPESGRVLVQAFLETESDDAIPVDQLVLDDGGQMPVLLLPPGEYRIVVQDEQGDEISRQPLVVVQPD